VYDPEFDEPVMEVVAAAVVAETKVGEAVAVPSVPM